MRRSAAPIFRGILSLSASTALVQLITSASAILLARGLGKFQYGLFSTITSYVGLFLMLFDAGISTYLTREGARRVTDFDEKFGGALLSMLALSALGYILMLSILPFTGYADEIHSLIFVAGAGIFFLQVQKALYSVLQVHQKQTFQAITEIVSAGGRLGLYIGAIAIGLGLRGIVVSGLLVPVATVGIAGFLVIKLYQMPVLTKRGASIVLKGSYFFGVSGILYFAHCKSSTLILSFIANPTDVGLYSAAHNFIVLGNEIPIVIMNYVMLPLMFGLGTRDKAWLFRVYKITFKYLLMFGSAISVGCILLAKQLVSLLYGTSYSEAAPILTVLGMALFARFLSYAPEAVLVSLDFIKIKIRIQACAAVIAVFSSVLLISWLGCVGAAVGVVVTEAVLALLYYRQVCQRFYPLSLFRDLKGIQVGTATICLAIFLYIARETMPVTVSVILGGLIYGIALRFSGFLSKDDPKLILDFFNKKLAGSDSHRQTYG